MLEIKLDTLPLHAQMKLLRLVADLTVAEVAARWGRSPAYVYRVERGEADPTPLEIKDAREVASAASLLTEARATAEGSDPDDRRAAIQESSDVASLKDARRGGKTRRPRGSPPAR